MSGLTWRSAISGVSVVLVVVAVTMALALSSETTTSSSGCSEAVCARVVTKCLLTERCKCNFALPTGANYTCYRDCFGCLAELCYDCCSCFGMCPRTMSLNSLNRVSSIEQLDEPIPRLFDIYTGDGGDDQLPPRYSVVTFEQEKTFAVQSPSSEKQSIRRNCTVAYATKCTSSDECNTMCRNMGASYSRWFHDGCCECVGAACLDYGLAEARCANCPPTLELLHLDKDDFYYGEDDVDDDGFFEDRHRHHHRNHWTTNVTSEDEEVTAEWKDLKKRDWSS